MPPPVSRTILLLLLLVVLLAPTSVSTMTLQGKRVLVTGAGRGIGRAIALICQKQGAQVAIASRTASQLEETAALAALTTTAAAAAVGKEEVCDTTTSTKKQQQTMLQLTCDVTNPTQVESMVQEIVDQWGGLDILINNAGGAQPSKGTVDSSPPTMMDPQEFLHLLQLNVVSVHIVTSAVLRLAMTQDDGGGGAGGHILNISSKAGKVGLANMSFYVASKFALEGLTATWAKELKERNIVVNSISPGMVDTQSFPKAPGRPGVRSAESIEDALIMALTAPMKFSGHYIHVDELDMTRKHKLPDSAAWKKIDEDPIEDLLPSTGGAGV